MEFMYHIGIDISKLTLDFCILDHNGEKIKDGVVQNNPESIEFWIRSLSSDLTEFKNTLVCMENSGYYGAHLLQLLNDCTSCAIWLENAVQIKRSMGLQRGKDDRTDAQRIASYSIDFQRRIRIWKPSGKSIEKLGLLISHRDRMVRNRVSILLGMKEQKGFVDDELQLELENISSPVLREMDISISLIEEKITLLISSDKQLCRQSEIIKSIPGFGDVVSSKIIGVTRGFSRLDNARSFACYAGVAPFNHSSGTSIKRRARVSHIANKEIKKMLHLAALVTIRKGGIMHAYYNRKMKEGKNKMAIINAVRNKLIHIMIACIKNDTMYVKNYNQILA